MANRTVQILGQGYGSNPAEITVTSNGNTVFSGTVNTLNQPLPELPDPSVQLTNVLCSFEIDAEFTGQIPMSCTVSSGTVMFADIQTNYKQLPNPVYTTEQFSTLIDSATTQVDRVAIRQSVANPPLSQQDIDILSNPPYLTEQQTEICVAHNCTTSISSGPLGYGPINKDGDPRSSITIDGIPRTPDHQGLPGPWWWTISNGSTLAYLLEVNCNVDLL